MTVRPFVISAALVVVASTAGAQVREPIGRVAVDARGASSGLPSAVGWTPVVPSATVLPTRGLGIDVGAHVYVLRFRGAAVGVGATWLAAGASTSPAEVDGAPTPTRVPDLSTRVRAFAPQLSLNFGHSLGWSYLSAGLGSGKVTSEATLASAASAASRDSGWVKALNFGGGARWFVADRVGVGFDVRWHKLGLVPASSIHPGAPRASLLVAGVGVSLK